MKRICCDADGVLIDFVSGLCQKLTARGFSRKPDEILHWDLSESLTAAEARESHAIMTEPGFCHSLEWYDGARTFLQELHAHGEVFVVTAPYDGSETWERERKAQMATMIPRKRVLPIPGEFKPLLRAAVLIEDHPGTAAAWARENPNGVAILINRPWNGVNAKEWDLATNMYRVRSYAEALDIIGGLS